MSNKKYQITDEDFASFAKKYPDMKRNDIEDLFARATFATKAESAQRSEIALLKSKALSAMGTENEMRFSDIETLMLKASLLDGRHALKEIIEKIPVETPLCKDGTKMKNQGRKKKA